jgi:hypothetical protein
MRPWIAAILSLARFQRARVRPRSTTVSRPPASTSTTRTMGLFKNLKPSDKSECLSRADQIPIVLTEQRNSVLLTCLSAADSAKPQLLVQPRGWAVEGNSRPSLCGNLVSAP